MENSKITLESFDSIKQDWLINSTEKELMKECTYAIGILKKTPKLLECGQNSIKQSILNISIIGLSLNPVMKLAYLMPKYNRDLKKNECVLEPSYIGLSKLLTDSGVVKTLEAALIWENDDITVDLSTEKKITSHTPYFLLGKEKGKFIGAYSKARLSDGYIHAEVMPASDVYEIRERSDAYIAYKAGKLKKCTWESDFSEMVRKSVFKRHYKRIPMSDKYSEKISAAIDLDNQVNGFDEVDFTTISYIDSLIHSSKLTSKEKHLLESQLNSLETQTRANELVSYLKDNQPEMGFDSSPSTSYQVSEAVKNRIDREDFQEDRKK